MLEIIYNLIVDIVIELNTSLLTLTEVVLHYLLPVQRKGN